MTSSFGKTGSIRRPHHRIRSAAKALTVPDDKRPVMRLFRPQSQLALAAAVLLAQPAAADELSYGPDLQGFDYPWPVAHFRFTSQTTPLDMAYMDVKPDHPNG
jgi:hypothetical protein